MKNRVLDKNNPLLLISLCQFCFSLGMSIVDPILPLYASSFNISYELVGIVIASFGFARIFTEIPGGLMTDRFGATFLLAFGYALCTISQLLGGIAQTYVELALARMIMGIGSALDLTASFTHLGEITTIETRQKYIALFQSAGTLAQIIGPTAGGVISDIAGRRSVFFVSALLFAISAVLVLKKVPKKTSASDRPRGIMPSRSDLIAILKDIHVIAISGSAFVMFFLYNSIRSPMIPLYGTEQFHLSSLQIGLVLSLNSIASFIVLLFISPRLEGIVSRSSLLPISLLVNSISVLALSFSSNFTTLAILTIFFGVGHGLLQPIPFTMIIDLSKPENRGLSMGILRTIADLGVIIGPIMVGLLMDLNQPLLVFYLVAGIVVAFSFITWIVFRKART